MARLPRLAVAGALHHVMQRGHDGQAVVRDDTDRERLLALVRESAAAAGVAVHAYALLDEALHLLVTPATAGALGRFMQDVGRRYVRAFNQRHGRSGTLWDGRFRSSVIEPGLLVEAMIHVEGLAHPAGTPAEAWPWSSAAHHLGRRRDPLLSDHPAYWGLGNTPFERESAHAHLLGLGVGAGLATRFEKALRSGHAVGSPGFVREVEGAAGRPAQPRVRGRPRLGRDGV
jgi:putative transposase